MEPALNLTELLVRESAQVEWKDQVADANDVVRTLVAFANDLPNLGGGRVVCGAREIKDEHGFPAVQLVGLSASRIADLRGRVMSACRQHVSPAIAPGVQELDGPGPDSRILVFTVVATGRAHALHEKDGNRTWVRLDQETREARNGILMRLLAARGEVEPWDRRLAPDATPDDLDLLALRDTLTRLKLWDPSRGVEHWLDPQVSLAASMQPLCGRDKAGAVRPRNFALLLFGQNPQRFIPGAVSRFSLYPGLMRSEPHSERLDLDGTLIAQANRLIDRLNVEAVTVMDKSSAGPDNLVRYPHRALKEAVVNALVHRDYTDDNPTRVTVFSDRVEIWSPGGLDPKVSADRFRAGTASPVWRNQSLAWIFYRLDLAQSEGQGIPTILDSMRNAGCPAPRFDLTEGSVTCVLPAHPRHALARELLQVEELISRGRLPEARERLEAMLDEDPTNFRILSLLTELVRSTRDDAPARRFALRHRDILHSLPAASQLALADALTVSPPDRDTATLARELLRRAGEGRLELADTRRLIISLLTVRDDEAAMSAIEAALYTHPSWREDPTLLQLRGRAWIQYAKRCRASLQEHNLTSRLRQNATRDLHAYLDRAEADLRASLAHGAFGVVREHAEDDLKFVARMRRRR